MLNRWKLFLSLLPSPIFIIAVIMIISQNWYFVLKLLGFWNMVDKYTCCFQFNVSIGKESGRGAERHLMFSWCQLAHSDQGCFVQLRFSFKTLPRALKHTLRHIYRHDKGNWDLHLLYKLTFWNHLQSYISIYWNLSPIQRNASCSPSILKIRTIIWVVP